MKRRFALMLISATMLAVASCSKESDDLDKPIVGLGGDNWIKGPIDEWIYSTFTKPYNIDVRYRWDGSELEHDRTLVPIKEEKVQPVMEVVKDAWIDVYVAEAGEVFIKKFAPKQYVLVGSPMYNTGNTITLGQAEGGRKVTLFQLNDFTKTNRPMIKEALHTIHHEFAHILHQNVMYSPEFQAITQSGYTADWNNISTADARAGGFITSYAQSGPNEDFVEMISMMVIEGKDGFDAMVNGASNATAIAALKKKEQMVVEYMKQVWNIDIYSLQARTYFKIAQMAPVSLVSVLGNGKQFTSVTINPAKVTGLSAEFTTVYNTAKAGLAAVGNAGRVLGAITLIFGPTNTAVLRVNYTNSAGSPFVANFNYTVAADANQNITLTYVSRDTNGNTVAPGIVALTNYLTQNSFKYSWFYQGFNEYGGFTKTSDANSFFYGNLGVEK